MANKNYKSIQSWMLHLFRQILMFVFFFVFITGANTIFASNVETKFQIAEVKGVVKDQEGIPLPGVTVTVKGADIGVVTDFDGIFMIEAEIGDTLVFSYIGFKTLEVVYAGQETLNLFMEEDTEVLDEVVVVGYGTKKVGELTTSIAKVKSEDLTALPAGNVVEALDGRAAGVKVLGTGAPGEDPRVLVRGINTFGNSSALIVADGVFIENLSAINPESIESIEVLKDAAAASIYGSRATNGVIIVTTKKGKANDNNKSKLTFKTYSGLQFLPENRFFDVIDGRQSYLIGLAEDLSPEATGRGLANTDPDNSPTRFFTNSNEGVPNSVFQPTDDLDPNFQISDVNWQRQLYQLAPIHSYDIGLSGAGGIGSYSLQAGYFDQTGIQKKTGLKRYSLSLNSQFKVSDKVTIGQVFNGGLTEFSIPQPDGGRSLQDWVTFSVPYLDPLAEDGRPIFPDGTLDRVLQSNNPLLLINLNENERLRRTMYGALSSTIKFSKNLRNITRAGFNVYEEDIDEIQRRASEADVVGRFNRINQTVTKQRNKSLNTNVSTNFTYNRSFGGHRIEATGVVELSNQKRTGIRVVQVSPDTPTDINALQESDDSRATSFNQNINIFSVLGRLDYNYKGKYLLSGSIRRDRASNFAFTDDNNVGVFRALSAGWVVSKESFLDGNSLLTYLKLKGSFGETGNNNVPANSIGQVFVSDSGINLSSEIVSQTLRAPTLASPDLTWEVSQKYNAGFDLELANSFTLNAEYFKSVNKDLILRELKSTSIGLTLDPFRNVGEVQTDGYEFTLGYKKRKGKLQGSIDANISFINNQVNKVTNTSGSLRGGQNRNFDNQFLNIIEVGQPFYGLLGQRTEGLFKSFDELKTAPLQDQRFRDITDTNNNTNSLTRSTVVGSDGVTSYIFTRNDGTTVAFENVGLDPVGTYLGDVRYANPNNTADANGNQVANAADDTVVIGDPNPDFTYSFNLKLYYKNFDLDVFFTGVYGNDVLNATKRGLFAFNAISNADVSILDRYRPALESLSTEQRAIYDQTLAFFQANNLDTTPLQPNTDTNVPRFDVGETRNSFASDRFIEDGSYLRLKNITLGYSIPKSVINKVASSLSKVRIYVSGQNLVTFTKYSGLDPEIQPQWSSGIRGIGIDDGFTPSPAQVLTGLQVEF